MAERLTFELDREMSAPRRARTALCEFDHGLDAQRESDAELLLTELVSNAVKYGEGGGVEVHLERERTCFRAEVVDEGDGLDFARSDSADPRAPGGWGLHLVDTLADRWGAHAGSTHVWFEMSG